MPTYTLQVREGDLLDLNSYINWQTSGYALDGGSWSGPLGANVASATIGEDFVDWTANSYLHNSLPDIVINRDNKTEPLEQFNVQIRYYWGTGIPHLDEYNFVIQIVDGGGVTEKPDLTVTLGNIADEVSVGESIRFTGTKVSNIGTGNAAQNSFSAYLSKDSVIGNGDDILIGNSSGPTTKNSSISLDNWYVSVPSNVASGQYYLGIKADSGNTVSEANENNNVALTTITIKGTADDKEVARLESGPTTSSFTNLSANIELTFSEKMVLHTREVHILQTLDGVTTMFEDFRTSSGSLSVVGNKLIINPSMPLVAGAKYTIGMDQDSVTDVAGNQPVSQYTWQFTTAGGVDRTAPTLNSFTTSSGSATANLFSDLYFTFSENVSVGSGAIQLLKLVNGQKIVVESFRSNDGKLTIDGSKITLDPTLDLSSNTDYFVRFENGAVKDSAGNLNSAIEQTFKSADFPVVSVSQTNNGFYEFHSGLREYSFVLTLDRPLMQSDDLFVHYKFAGTAVNGEDYIDQDSVAVFHRGESSTEIVFLVKGDIAAEDSETISVILEDGPLYNLPNGASQMSSGTHTILDDDERTGVEVSGTTGGETLNGTSAGEVLRGEAGRDFINGGSGNDLIHGGLGRDILSGDDGADVFSFAAANESPYKGRNYDSIADFNSREGDSIDLTAIDANTGKIGNQAFKFVGYSANFSGRGELDFYYESDGNTGVYGYTDKDAKPEFYFEIEGRVKVVAGDFIL